MVARAIEPCSDKILKRLVMREFLHSLTTHFSPSALMTLETIWIPGGVGSPGPCGRGWGAAPWSRPLEAIWRPLIVTPQNASRPCPAETGRQQERTERARPLHPAALQREGPSRGSQTVPLVHLTEPLAWLSCTWVPSLFKNPFAKIARCKPGSGLPCCVFVSHKVTWSVGKPLGLHPAQVQRRQPLTLLSFSGRRWMEVIRSATSSTSRAHVLSHRESHGY